MNTAAEPDKLDQISKQLDAILKVLQDIRAILTGQPNRGLSADELHALTSRRR